MSTLSGPGTDARRSEVPVSTDPSLAVIDPSTELRIRAFARWRVLVYVLLFVLAVALIRIAPGTQPPASGPETSATP